MAKEKINFIKLTKVTCKALYARIAELKEGGIVYGGVLNSGMEDIPSGAIALGASGFKIREEYAQKIEEFFNSLD